MRTLHVFTMKLIRELHNQCTKIRDEMELVTRRLNSQAVMAGTLQHVRNVVANLEEVCEQFGALEFILDPSSKSVSNAAEAYDGSVSESESSGVDVDEGTTESSSERNTMEDERDLDWLSVASLNAKDVPVDSKIKFQYEFGGQLKMYEGKVLKLGQDVVVVQTSSGLETYYKNKMKDVMISSSAQAARI